MPDLDQTANYNTPLTPAEEAAFQQWVQASGRVRDLADYDLRGAWKKAAREASNGHFPDDWKKPNHPTFSRESIYSGPYATGGNWAETPQGWAFQAAPDNFHYRDQNALREYFNRVEPNAQLLIPNALGRR